MATVSAEKRFGRRLAGRQTGDITIDSPKVQEN